MGHFISERIFVPIGNQKTLYLICGSPHDFPVLFVDEEREVIYRSFIQTQGGMFYTKEKMP